MRYLNLLILSILSFSSTLFAQFPGAARSGGATQNGRFYGKVVDKTTGKGIDAATITLVTKTFDRATKTAKDSIISGFLTSGNGDFSLENIPFMGDYTLIVTAIGYTEIDNKVSFLTADQQKKMMAAMAQMGKKTESGKTAPNPMEIMKEIMAGDMSKMASMADKDLGNIELKQDTKMLEGVTITGSRPTMKLEVDRRVFNVDKTLSSSGSSATDIMRQIPSVNVDIDGNVSVRNASPTLFVDGRPTTLTLDQIPADDIESVELITNPSAKFDASGGTSAILNIVLKKNKKIGYNGSIRTGIDSRFRPNFGGDIAVRQGKINAFLNGSFNMRKSISSSNIETNYTATGNNPASAISQAINSTNRGFFAFGRGGIDFLADNRNTFTLSFNYVKGSFKSEDINRMSYDSFYNPIVSESGIRSTLGDRSFRNAGASLGFKHLFEKAGHEITADANYSESRFLGPSNYKNELFDANNNSKGNPLLQITDGLGGSKYFVMQTDYANPISANLKLELGLRGQVRDFENSNQNSIFNYSTNKYELQEFLSSSYTYTDRVYAAYSTLTGKVDKLGYNVGLRMESSSYNGKSTDTDSSFNVDFPLSLFPSAFLSYSLNDNSDLQANYSRRINRPNFFQLIPFIDYNDPLNLSQGNPSLTPEFTNSFEINYTYKFNNLHSILISTYYKNTDNLLTRYQYKGLNQITGDSAIYNTWVNANSSTSYGLEFTSTNKITKRFDAITNANFYNASINSENLQQNLNNSQFSYFVKTTLTYKLGKTNNWTIQMNADYQSKTVLPVGGSTMMRGPNSGNQAAGSNGYINPNYGVDLSVKKDIIKNKNGQGYQGSITLSSNDIFRTRIYDAQTSSDFFSQDLTRRRDAQVLRLQFQWRFGKFDSSLFRRKNMKGEMEGASEGMQGGM